VPVVPSSHTFVDGVATSSEQNTYVRDPIAFLLRPPTAELRQIVAQTLTTAVGGAITFTTEDLDSDPDGTGGHDNLTNPSRYTARYPGWYMVSGAVCFVANATGMRHAYLRVNGADVLGSVGSCTPSAADVVAANCRPRKVFLNQADYVELVGYQSSGGNLNTFVTTTPYQSGMSVHWVSN
jgi:hypothetical protein